MLGEIRKAGRADAAAIAAIHVASWRVTYANTLPAGYLRGLGVPALTRRWGQRLGSLGAGGERVLVSTREDRVTGFVSFGASREHSEDPGFAGEITMLYVHPELEGLGFGSSLLSRAVADLRAAGLYWAVIWVVEDNHAALDFYRRHGFELDGGRRVDGIGGGRTPLLRVAKPLKPRIEL